MSSSAASQQRTIAAQPAARRHLNARQAETVAKLFTSAAEELRGTTFDLLTVRAVAARAGVSAATAYTYFSSKNHLVAELFWRRLHDRPRVEQTKRKPLTRVSAVFDDLAEFLSGEPELAAAVTTALLDADPDIHRLQVMIGNEINGRIVEALGPSASPAVLDAIGLAWSGAMLQAGMGHARFSDLGARLTAVARLVLEPRRTEAR